MATETVEHSGGEPLADIVWRETDEIGNAIDRASWFLSLAQWVEQARALIEDVQVSAEISPLFKGALREQSVPFGLTFGKDESAGLQALLYEVQYEFTLAKGRAENLGALSTSKQGEANHEG